MITADQPESEAKLGTIDIAPGEPARQPREMIMRCPTSPVTRVVVGVDGSAAAAAAVQWAAAEACRRQATLHIVSAWCQRDEASTRLAGDPAVIAATWVQRALTRVLRRDHYPWRIACAALRGAPGETLLNTVGEAGLLVLGVTGASAGLLPGRVNRYCLRHGRGPLVFVPAAPPR